ncbi:MAG: hypothetical protein HC896_17530, partial [Bacteroidales bacterium]|nr:hypothetical protein [Bacteroidales bacterium]
MNNLPFAIKHLEHAYRADSGQVSLLKDMGVAYGLNGQYQHALAVLEKAIALDSADYQLYINLGLTNQLLGNHDLSVQYFQKAESLKLPIKHQLRHLWQFKPYPLCFSPDSNTTHN